MEGLCWPRGCLLVGSEPWVGIELGMVEWEIVSQAHVASPQNQRFFPLLAPFSPSWAGNWGHCPQSICPCPRSTEGLLSHLCPSAALNLVFGAWFWESEDLVVPVGMEERAMEVAFIRPQNPSLVPPTPLTALSSQHSMGTAGAARQCCASSKLIGIVTCLPLLVRAPASLGL